METNTDFKKALLCFYWLMAGADGNISTSEDDPEWIVLKKMQAIEKISEKEVEDFLNGDKQENHLFEKLMVNLVIVSHRERLKALAWMDLVMFADGYLHDNELKLFNSVCKRFEIDDEDVKGMKDHLLEVIASYDFS
jgi:uncharacterized tellurite resistance protein B-like protein